MLQIVTTKSFRKDYRKAIKQGKRISVLDDIIFTLAHSKPLASKYKDHSLSGKYIRKRECHLEPDWLLIYEATEIELILYRTGSHSELFKK